MSRVVINDAVAVLLCGGKSKRMGFDKAFLEMNEHWLLLQKADLLSGIFSNVVLMSNSIEKFNQKIQGKKYEILQDNYEAKGPLGAICTAMEEIESEFFFIVACDMPDQNIDPILLLNQDKLDYQVTLFEHSGKKEPLFAFYHKSCLPIFQRQLNHDELKLRARFHELHVKEVHIDENIAKKVFFNLNTPEDIEKFRRSSIR